MKMTTANFKPTNETERMMATLPKVCTCNMCTVSKNVALETLGKKRFNAICKILDIAI
jgi:hypothetical protein